MDYYDLATIARHASWTTFQQGRAAGRLVLLDDGRDRLPDAAFQPGDSCCWAARAPACRPRCMPPPTFACVSRCRKAPAPSMSRWPRRWLLGEALRQNQRIRSPRMILAPRTATSPSGPSPLPDEPTVARRKEEARAWFEKLRDRICAAFEKIEGELTGTHRELPPGRFERQPWQREPGPNGEDRGGGTMAIMRGRVFEKVGVTSRRCSANSAPSSAARFPAPRRIRASSPPASRWSPHLRSPRVPAVHMNTRFIVTTRAWFGGGTDLTPMVPNTEDTHAFHAALKAACDAHDPTHYPRFKEWCDEYFYLPHRSEPRGVGGIFYDYLDSGDFARDFAFTRSVGETFSTSTPGWCAVT